MKKQYLWIAILITLFRIIYLFFNQRDLDIEESQYWAWSRDLAFGYHSKPPMISWIIYLSTVLFGNDEWAIRIFSPITYFFSSCLLYGLGKKLYQEEVGFWSGLTVLLLPGVTYSSTIISTDPLLLFFWSLALFSLVSACQSQRLVWWVICGVAVGLGLLSKYTMFAFLLSMILYLICSADHQSLLKKPGPYLTILIGLLIFLPNVIWNLQHDNPTLHHVVSHNVNIKGFNLNFKNLAFFIFTQLGILTPIVFFFLIAALFRSQAKDNTRLLICFTVPMLMMICIEALLSRAYANWAVVAYPSGVVLAVAYMWEQKHRLWLFVNGWSQFAVAIALCAWELAIAYGFCQSPISNNFGWRDFGNILEVFSARYPQQLFLIDNRELWSKVLYYGRVSKDRVFVWDPNHNVDWLDSSTHHLLQKDQDFILITYQMYLPWEITYSFKHIEEIITIPVQQRLNGRKNNIYVYLLQKFK